MIKVNNKAINNFFNKSNAVKYRRPVYYMKTELIIKYLYIIESKLFHAWLIRNAIKCSGDEEKHASATFLFPIGFD